MALEVIIGPGAFEDLDAIHRYISSVANADVADAYQARIIRRCQAMGVAPLVGTPHDELLPGLRTAPFERRATIACKIDGDIVTIVRVIHAGRDIGTAFA